MAESNEDSPENPSGVPRRASRAAGTPAVIRSGKEAISAELALTIFRQMIRTRALEERSIKMSKSGEAYFWVGGPGEEAVNVALGMQVHKGQGPAYDYLHLHYRSAGTLLAMGMPMLDHVRQLAMTATDPYSRGRNFVGHYAVPAWNIPPVSSVIEIQCTMAPGTALVQKRAGGDALTVAVSGDAGTAEGDFESCLLWSSRPGNELPVLLLVTNNGFGISTTHGSQHADRRIADRAAPYHVRAETVDGTDTVAAWHGIDRAMRYVRRERKPFLLETLVGRLHGHSSSSGAQRVWDQPDCLALFEQKLIDAHATDANAVRQMWDEARKEADAAVVKATSEPKPTKEDVERDTYAPSEVDVVYPRDYTGLPRRAG
ncbi:thiamine pyrophosphate-dependent dehydrogenase E1 component subunit alpha [Fimbriiglobus ruber]|uniref:2-oxoisovalerate dehydrogenase subunit alpha n=1 Tax=Fimbriiglobus ruber TaxID=1908690 RepID=A0A225DLL8_9BACT|nr:thiamine pyrophosphate-dependent enzyme [Fimbriiglobus ruber]OWK42311.1 Branched-chain alpha-keto acid dehydrogenase, E1 component, alpha subunit [Fimbriiglobus ruber]